VLPSQLALVVSPSDLAAAVRSLRNSEWNTITLIHIPVGARRLPPTMDLSVPEFLDVLILQSFQYFAS